MVDNFAGMAVMLNDENTHITSLIGVMHKELEKAPTDEAREFFLNVIKELNIIASRNDSVQMGIHGVAHFDTQPIKERSQAREALVTSDINIYHKESDLERQFK